jgi:hypothetical protein
MLFLAWFIIQLYRYGVNIKTIRIWEHLPRLKWIKIVRFTCVNIELRTTRGLAAWAVICISITAHEQAQSNWACNMFIFFEFGGFQCSIVIYYGIIKVFPNIYILYACEICSWHKAPVAVIMFNYSWIRVNICMKRYWNICPIDVHTDAHLMVLNCRIKLLIIHLLEELQLVHLSTYFFKTVLNVYKPITSDPWT